MHSPIRKAVFVAALAVAVLLAAGVFVDRSGRAGEIFTEDLEQAKKTAAAENKDLFLFFTGSDWCGWCKRLEAEVLSKEAFQKSAPEEFVLVKLDFPRQRELSPEIKQRNEQLRQQYEIQGFPTIVLASPDGEAYARTGYREGGAEAYVAHLNELQAARQKRQELQEQAAQAEGVEKAKLLDQLVQARDEAGLEVSDETLRQILESDPQNEAGLKKTYEARLALSDLQSGLQEAQQQNDPQKALQLIQETLDDQQIELDPEQRQHLQASRGMILMSTGKPDAAIEAFEVARKEAPESEVAPQLAQVQEQIRKQMAQAPAPGQQQPQ